jgi:streptogramin lyase
MSVPSREDQDPPGAPALPATALIADQAIATLTIPGYVDFLAADGQGVWATNIDRVERFEADQPGPVEVIAMPKPCGAMVVADGSLWVASCHDQSIYRIDLASRRIAAKIPTGLADPDGELSLAAGAGSIWVLSSTSGVLTRIDATRNEIVARIGVRPHSYSAAFAFDAVWITNSASGDAPTWGSVQRIDPTKDVVVSTIPTGPDPRFLAAGEGGVWSLNWGDGSVTRIDPDTNQPVVTLSLGMEGGGGDIATGAGRVWVRGTGVLLVSVDPATNTVAAVYGPPAGSGAVRVAQDLVWVTAHDTNTVWVLRAAS